MKTSFETVETQWFNEEAIRLPNYKVGRVNYGYGRSYIRLIDGELEQPFRLYTSLTTAISSCAPMERPLLEWYCKLGLQEADRQLKLSQHYGSLMHIMIGEYLINNFIDLDINQVTNRVDLYLAEQDFYDSETGGWAEKLQYDLVAFIAFAQQHNVQPLGIEYVLLSNRGFGTLIDLVCKMDIEEKGFFGEVYKSGAQAGMPKETKRIRNITGLINFKSGRRGFYRSNGIQIECERQLWEENFPDIKIDAAFNWSPKEWITEPGWNFKNWTDEIEQQEIESIIALAEIRFATKALNKKYLTISGTAISTRPVSDLIQTKTAEQYCKEKYSTIPS